MALESFSRIYRKKHLINMIALIACVILSLSAFFIEFGISIAKSNNPRTINSSSDMKKASKNNTYVKIKAKHIYNLSFEMDKHELYGMVWNDKIVTIEVTKGDKAKVIKNSDGTYSINGVVCTYNNEEFNNLKSSLKARGFTQTQLNSLLSRQYLKYGFSYKNLCTRLPIEVIILIILFLKPIFYLWTNRKVSLSTHIYSRGNTKAFYLEIDKQLSNLGVISKEPFTITQDYIIVSSKRIMLAFPISGLVWIFKTERKRYFWSRDKVVLILSTGEQYHVSINRQQEDSVEEVIRQISIKSPTTFTGTSKEHYLLYKKHRAEFMKYWIRRTEEEKAKQSNNIN